ncbi:MAG: GDP-mannose 4,6-dehydratase [Candidatus Omnitrophica bacterium]|nr:GDP-mannose 4,6-dehydratase [Candidatus Omnitrophota bacterium]
MTDFWRNKKVIVTGANGFLGSHLTLELLRKKAVVTGIIKEKVPASYLHRHCVSGSCPGRLQLITCDIADTRKVLRVFGRVKPQVCLHVAAQPLVGLANKSPLGTFESNITGSWNILEAVRRTGVESTVVASSDKAYGEHKILPYRETSALRALHPYDASKACTDILTQVYAHTWGVKTAVTRCANIYGPGDMNFSRIIPDTMRAVIRSVPPVIRSDGTPVRDYVYIADVVDAYLLLAQRLFSGKVSSGEAFNFGNGKPIDVLSLVRKILRIAGRSDLIPVIKSSGKISGEIDRQYLSSVKARRVLGWRPRYSLDKGLRLTLKWYGHYCAAGR